MRAIFPHAGNSECGIGCWSHSPGDWGSVVATATEVQLLSSPKVRAPPEGCRNVESAAVAAVLVEEEESLVLDESGLNRGDEAESMEVESDLVGFKAANFDHSLSQGRYHEMEGVSDGRKGELRTKERSESTNFQSGSHQRPIALN